MFEFTLHATDGPARAGTFTTPHGDVPTPVFMPVGTLGTVKGVSPEEIAGVGACMILANTYHLYLRPGHELVRDLGQIRSFMRWDGPVLTDSGGFQVFSLANTREIRDEGVVFRSHVDGSSHCFTPELVMDIQRALGADVVMAFDECPPGGVERATAKEANRRTLEWLRRCRARFKELTAEDPTALQSLFPVLQGNVFEDLRLEQLAAFLDLGEWDGMGIGGLSVGEDKDEMWRILDILDPEIPPGMPRYLMGVGYPDDLLEAIARGLRHVRLRRPDAECPTCYCMVRPRGTVEPEGCPLRARQGPDRSRLRLLHLPGVRPGIHSAPMRFARAFRRALGVNPQSAIPDPACRGVPRAHREWYLPFLGSELDRTVSDGLGRQGSCGVTRGDACGAAPPILTTSTETCFV